MIASSMLRRTSAGHTPGNNPETSLHPLLLLLLPAGAGSVEAIGPPEEESDDDDDDDRDRGERRGAEAGAQLEE